MWFSIEGAKVRIRRLRDTDLANFQSYRNDPDVGRFQGWTRMSDAEALRFFTEMQQDDLLVAGDWRQLAIALSTTDELIGDIGLHLSEDQKEVTIGFTLHPASQGKGLAFEALSLLLPILFSEPELTRLMGFTDSRNSPSIRLLERLGLTLISTEKQFWNGEWATEHVYELRRETFTSAGR